MIIEQKQTKREIILGKMLNTSIKSKIEPITFKKNKALKWSEVKIVGHRASCMTAVYAKDKLSRTIAFIHKEPPSVDICGNCHLNGAPTVKRTIQLVCPKAIIKK